MTVTIYSTPNCQQCRATKRKMNDLGIESVEVDLTADVEAHARVTEMGYVAAPVVITDDGDHWSGFRPDKIKSLAAAAA